ncbi:MAG: polymorphic toxin-type HINT domain-containing protein, partial [Kiritimatiellae bacterium]|nr:polymorphic toxin-type HINT domain-containing protein [Kiritimatiellia bacterium]
ADIPVIESRSLFAGRWVEARDLRSGDALLLRDGHSAVVVAAEVFEAATVVFNLTISELHTYAVSSIGVLVHNKAAENMGRQLTKDKNYAMKTLGACS